VSFYYLVLRLFEYPIWIFSEHSDCGGIICSFFIDFWKV